MIARVSLSHHRGPTPARRVRAPGQMGETLLEVLIAVVLMALGFSIVLAGMITSSRVAARNQERTRANVALQSYAEQLLQPVGSTAYKPCGTVPGAPLSYIGVYAPSPKTGTLPSGWAIRVEEVRYARPGVTTLNADGVPVIDFTPWGDNGTLECVNGGAGPNYGDGGLQELKIVVEKPDGGGAGGMLVVDRMVISKRDQRCPTTGYANVDRGPC